MDLKDASIDELQTELDRRKASGMVQWPKCIRLWAHTSDAHENEDVSAFADLAWGQGQAPRLFWYIGAEIRVDFEVQQDGNATVAALYTNGLRYEAVGPQHEKE